MRGGIGTMGFSCTKATRAVTIGAPLHRRRSPRCVLHSDTFLPTPPPPPPPAHLHSGWKATSIGSNSESAKATLKAEYKADFSLTAAAELALKTLTKAMDTTAPSSEKVEVAVLTRNDAGALIQKQYTAAEVDALLAVIKAAAPAAVTTAAT